MSSTFFQNQNEKRDFDEQGPGEMNGGVELLEVCKPPVAPEQLDLFHNKHKKTIVSGSGYVS